MTSMSQSGAKPGALESLIHQSDDVGELLRADDSLLRQQFFSILKEHHPQVNTLFYATEQSLPPQCQCMKFPFTNAGPFCKVLCACCLRCKGECIIGNFATLFKS